MGGPWGCDLKVLKRSAGGIATRRARPIRFVVAPRPLASFHYTLTFHSCATTNRIGRIHAGCSVRTQSQTLDAVATARDVRTGPAREVPAPPRCGTLNSLPLPPMPRRPSTAPLGRHAPRAARVLRAPGQRKRHRDKRVKYVLPWKKQLP